MRNTPFLPAVLIRFPCTFAVLFTLFSCTQKEIVYVYPPPHFSDRRVAPIKISYFSRNLVRASITIRIDGIPVDVLFDTGSSGLRVLAGAIKGAPIDTDLEWVRYFYSGGVGLYGKVAGAYLSIGGLSGTTPVKIMRIDSARDGTKAKWEPTGDSPYVNNGLLQGFNGIVGVGLRDTSVNFGVVSPLPQLPGNGRFIVHFPQYNGVEGSLILNPSEEDLKGFTYIHLQKDLILFPNGFNGWRDNELKDTLTVNGVPYTSNALLDSGNPASQFYKDPASDTAKVAPGAIVRFTLGPPFAGGITFTVKDQQSGLDLVETSNYAVRNVFGIQFFFDFDVLYDQKNGLIGIRRK